VEIRAGETPFQGFFQNKQTKRKFLVIECNAGRKECAFYNFYIGKKIVIPNLTSPRNINELVIQILMRDKVE